MNLVEKRCYCEDVKYQNEEITDAIIGSAIEVHRHLGPGLLESVYETSLAYELVERKLRIETQKRIPVVYKKITFEEAFRIDLLVENEVIVELKCVD